MTIIDRVASVYALVAMALPIVTGIALVGAHSIIARLWMTGFGGRPAVPRGIGYAIVAVLGVLPLVALVGMGTVLVRVIDLPPGAPGFRSASIELLLLVGPAAIYAYVFMHGVVFYVRGRYHGVPATWQKWVAHFGLQVFDTLRFAEWRRTASARHLAWPGIALLVMESATLGSLGGLNASPYYAQIATIVVMGQIVVAYAMWLVYLAGNPQLRLVSICLAENRVRSPREAVRYSSKPGRWRSHSHRAGFIAARCLTRCTRATSLRLSVDQARLVDMTYRRLGESLRRGELAAGESDRGREEFTELLRAATTIVAVVNVASAARVVHTLIRRHPRLPDDHVGRWRRMTDTVSDGLQRYWPAIQIVNSVIIIVILLAIGSFERIIDLATQ